MQKHAFELGYAWSDERNAIHYTKEKWLDFWVTSVITHCNCDAQCDGHALVTAADFLALESAKDEPTLKPFDKVLIRDHLADIWHAGFFSDYREEYFGVVGGTWRYCIPYEGNQALLGTTKDAK